MFCFFNIEKKNSSNGPWKAEFGGIAKKNCMSKVRNFAELAPNIGFSEFDLYDLYRSTFEMSELGSIKKLLPLREMAENFGLVSKSMRPNLLPQNFDKSLLKLENASEKYGESLKG